MKLHSFLSFAFFSILIGASVAGKNAHAATTQWQDGEYAKVRLFAGVEAGAHEIKGGLHIRLQPDWHAYWRMPGDGGLAPRFDWRASTNMGTVAISWPAPERFEMLGLHSFGYKGDVVLPFSAKLENSELDTHINLQTDIMVCFDICIPQKFAMTLDVPAGAALDVDDAKLLRGFEARLPVKGDHPNLRIESTVIGPEALVVRAYAAKGFEGADLFVEIDDQSTYVTAKPEITADADDKRRATLRVKTPEGAGNLAEIIAGRSVTLTLKTPSLAVEKTTKF